MEAADDLRCAGRPAGRRARSRVLGPARLPPRALGAARRFPALFFIFVLGGEDPIGPRPLPGDRHRQNFR